MCQCHFCVLLGKHMLYQYLSIMSKSVPFWIISKFQSFYCALGKKSIISYGYLMCFCKEKIGDLVSSTLKIYPWIQTVKAFIQIFHFFTYSNWFALRRFPFVCSFHEKLRSKYNFYHTYNLILSTLFLKCNTYLTN